MKWLIALVLSSGCITGFKITPPPKPTEPTDEEVAAMVDALVSLIFTGGMLHAEDDGGWVPGEGN